MLYFYLWIFDKIPKNHFQREKTFDHPNQSEKIQFRFISNSHWWLFIVCSNHWTHPRGRHTYAPNMHIKNLSVLFTIVHVSLLVSVCAFMHWCEYGVWFFSYRGTCHSAKYKRCFRFVIVVALLTHCAHRVTIFTYALLHFFSLAL